MIKPITTDKVIVHISLPVGLAYGEAVFLIQDAIDKRAEQPDWPANFAAQTDDLTINQQALNDDVDPCPDHDEEDA